MSEPVMLSFASSMRASVLVAATTLGASACARDEVPAQTSSSDDDSSTTTTESGDTTQTSSTTGDSLDSVNDSLDFDAGPDTDVAAIVDCDPFAQDCPEGDKCVPYASTGSTWNANKCVPVMGTSQAGDPCVSSGVVEATDNCDEASFCWNVMDVDGMDVGVCTEFCLGIPDDPLCPAGTSCVFGNANSITLCLQTCDPLLQACGAGLACYWTTNNFNCVFVGADAPLGQPCSVAFNACAGGTTCVAAELLPSCDDVGCCASFCSLSAPVCPQPETACASFFEMGQVPPDYMDVGICITPAP